MELPCTENPPRKRSENKPQSRYLLNNLTSPYHYPLAKFEVQKIFGDDIGVNYNDVEKKIQKKKYYENNRSKALFKTDNLRPKIRIEGVNELSIAGASASASASAKDEVATPGNVDIDQSPIFSHKQINELIKMKEQVGQTKEVVEANSDNVAKKGNLEEKVEVHRMGRRTYLDQLNEFINVLTCIGVSAKVYGKALSKLDSKQGVFGQEESVLLKQEEKSLNVYPLDQLNNKDKDFVKKMFGNEFIEKNAISLPEWLQIKQTVNEVGKVELNCARFVEMV